MSSPIEQFEIKKIIPFEVNGTDLSFTNSSLCMMITIAVILLSMAFCLRKRDIVPRRSDFHRHDELVSE